MYETLINILLNLVVLVIGGTMAFATFFVAQMEKKDKLRRENDDER